LAFAPLTVTTAAIFSNLFTPKLLIVNLAFVYIGFYPVKSSKTLPALVKLSPEDPTQQFITNFSILIFLIKLSDFCFLGATGAYSAFSFGAYYG